MPLLPNALQLLLGVLVGSLVLRPDTIKPSEFQWPLNVPYDPAAQTFWGAQQIPEFGTLKRRSRVRERKNLPLNHHRTL